MHCHEFAQDLAPRLTRIGLGVLLLTAAIPGTTGCEKAPTMAISRQLEPAANCSQSCLETARYFLKGEMGEDPTHGLPLPRVKSADELLPAAVRDGSHLPDGSGIVSVPLDDALKHAAESTGCSVALVSPAGHIHLILGTAVESGHVKYQVLHGSERLALHTAHELRARSWASVWRVKRSGDTDSPVELSIGGQRLHVDRLSKNLGHVTPFRRHTAEFVIRNVGPGVIEVSDTHTSCGCTTAKVMPSRVLRHGDTAVISATVDSGGDRALGEFVWVDFKDTQSGATRRVRFGMMATQETTMTVSPDHLNFGTVKVGMTGSRSIHLREADGDRFTIKRIVADGIPLRHTVHTTTSKLNDYDIRLTLDTSLVSPRSELRGALRILTTSLVRPEVTVPVKAFVASNVTLLPDTVAFGRVK